MIGALYFLGVVDEVHQDLFTDFRLDRFHSFVGFQGVHRLPIMSESKCVIIFLILLISHLNAHHQRINGLAFR